MCDLISLVRIPGKMRGLDLSYRVEDRTSEMTKPVLIVLLYSLC